MITDNTYVLLYTCVLLHMRKKSVGGKIGLDLAESFAESLALCARVS